MQLDRLPLLLLVPIALIGAASLGAQAGARPAGSPASVAAQDSTPACCTIVRIDSASSHVTARELATGFTFVFVVRSRKGLHALKLGAPVWADFSRKTVRLAARASESCCTMLPQP